MSYIFGYYLCIFCEKIITNKVVVYILDTVHLFKCLEFKPDKTNNQIYLTELAMPRGQLNKLQTSVKVYRQICDFF